MKFLVGERRAAAAAVVAFYGFFFTAMLLSGMAPPEMTPMLTALASLYGVAFFGLVSGWFWGRWYASGLGMFGLVSGALGIFQLGLEPVLVFFTISHAILPAFLAGESMAAGFDGRTEWRTRFHLDDPAVERLGKSITRAAMSLPYLLLWALGPKQPGQAFFIDALPFVLGAAGLWAVVRMRTWGVLALAGAGATLAATAATASGPTPVGAIAVAGLLAAAAVPFVRPIARHLGSAAR